MNNIDRYKELYKKYRPKNWKDIIGQDNIVKSLQSNVKKGDIPTAYGFFGTHGCGKTSTAKILAKSLNCTNLQNNQEPCNKCDSCISIDNDESYDVKYESMANSGGAEDIRKLVQEAKLQTPGKKSVYILDEVHNLSKAAFDALLIPLEQDKMNTLFILCSTEPEKIPRTILSRIQTKNFTPISYSLLTRYVKMVSEKESITINDNDIKNIVKSGRGSARDTLTAMEKYINEGSISKTDNQELEYAKKFVKIMCMSKNDKACLVDAFKLIEMAEDNCNLELLLEDIFTQSRNYLLMLDKKNMTTLGNRGNPYEFLQNLMISVANAYDKVKSNISLDPRIYLEFVVVELIKNNSIDIWG